MMPERDPFDILRENNPFDPSQAPDGASAEAQALLALIKATDPGKVRSGHLRPRIAVVLVTLLLIAAASIVWMRAADVQGVACFDAPSMEGTRVGVRPEGAPEVWDCEPLWREGVLENPTIAEPGSVPRLVGCVTDAGALWVFPADDEATCEQLGLARLDDGETGDRESILQAHLVSLFGEHDCLDMDTAKATIETHLTDLELERWVVTTQPTTEERPCSSFSLDYATKQVILVPMIRFDG